MLKNLSSVLFSLLCLAISFNSTAQAPQWTILPDNSVQQALKTQQIIIPDKSKLLEINFKNLQAFLNEVPMSGTKTEQEIVMEIPNAVGQMTEFVIENSQVFSPILAQKYPSIRSFNATKKDNRSVTAKIGISPKGFHAMILDPEMGTQFIDVYAPGSKNFYQVYFKKDFTEQNAFECLVADKAVDLGKTKSLAAGDCQLRTYRLALACTGEYSTFHGGTKESVMAEFNVAMGRVNGIYEKDLGITMVLVDNTDEVIYLNAGSDPYTNNSGGTMLGENQNTLDDVIGAANYDIGHVFSTGGGGIASLNAPCNSNNKARGVTGLGSPVNDPFYVDYVCHEMGHQFGANHTQNNSCNRVESTSMEVGSANTIMGYAGICAPNSKNNSDDHFHAISIQEITNYIVNGNGGNCPVFSTTDNVAPIVSFDQPNYNVPIGTAFMLTANATDANGDMLTYCWEQMDPEIADMPPNNTSTQGPAFISNSPLESPTRVFPNIDAVVNNVIPQWEVVPFVGRNMKFRCTVRDNSAGLGCTDEENLELIFDNDTGPFLVTNPNTSLDWNATDEVSVSWDVAGTDLAPVSCDLVDILLSLDGGYTYPITLATDVANTGETQIVVPDVQTDQARVMVKCADNVFFDISDTNFSITTPFSFTFLPESIAVCEGEDFEMVINTQAFAGFDEEITFSIEDLPGATTAEFSVNPVMAPAPTTLLLSNVTGGQGMYMIKVIAETPSLTIEKFLELIIEIDDISGFELQVPADGSQGVATALDLSWISVPGAGEIKLQVATDPAFINIVKEVIVQGGSQASVTGLDGQTVYYWRLNVVTDCVSQPFTDYFAFQTGGELCTTFSSADIPVVISENSAGTITSDLIIEDVDNFDFIKTKLDVKHSWIGDMKIVLQSAEGTPMTLVDQMGVPESQYGCDESDLLMIFSDFSPNSADALENSCTDLFDSYQPVTPLSVINAESANGTWELSIEDFFDDDGGSLDAWEVQFCSNSSAGQVELDKVPLELFAGFNKPIGTENLQIIADPNAALEYVVTKVPVHGNLELDSNGDGEFNELLFGMIFTQEDINEDRFRYQHNGNDAEMDQFLFDVIDNQGKWAHNENLDIIIIQEGFAAQAEVDENIVCFGETGQISAIVTGGQAPFMYSIDGDNFQDSPIFMNLAPGQYEITARDDLGQEYVTNAVVLNNPAEIIASGTLNFYDLEVMASGGTGTLSFSIDGVNYQDSPVFPNIPNDSYTIFVKDENGCIKSFTQDVQILALEDFGTEGFDLLCFEDMTGSIDVNVQNGFESYQYSLDDVNYQMSSSFINLQAGNYTVYVLDAGSAKIEIEISISEPDPITFTYVIDGDVITFEAQGGTGSYVYSIDGGTSFQTGNTFTLGEGGEYTLLVKDENECTDSQNEMILFTDTKESELAHSLSIYPNPADQNIQFDWGNTFQTYELELEFINSLGQKIKELKISKPVGATSVDVSDFPSGIFYINLTFGNTVVTKKMVKIDQ